MERETVIHELKKTRCCLWRRPHAWYLDLMDLVDAMIPSAAYKQDDRGAIRAILRDKGSMDTRNRKTRILYRYLINKRADSIFTKNPSLERYDVRMQSITDGQKIRFVREYHLRFTDSRVYFIPTDRKNNYDYVRTMDDGYLLPADFHRLIGSSHFLDGFQP
jgi:hypothetical protein